VKGHIGGTARRLLASFPQVFQVGRTALILVELAVLDHALSDQLVEVAPDTPEMSRQRSEPEWGEALDPSFGHCRSLESLHPPAPMDASWTDQSMLFPSTSRR
jgi:hypothetical protein